MKFEFCEQPMGRTGEVLAEKLIMTMERRKLMLLQGFLKTKSIIFYRSDIII